MRLVSITANRHIFDGKVNGSPLRLLLAFDNGRQLRLRGAADGEGMILEDRPLDEPCDLEEYGRTDIADVTRSLFPTLGGMEVAAIRALALHGKRVGVRLDAADGDAFHFWVAGDELYWGDESALLAEDWLDGIVPVPSEAVQL